MERNIPQNPTSIHTNITSSPKEQDSSLTTQNLQIAKPFWVEKLKSEAGKNWDLFYKHHANRFFKDRHWTTKEFEELADLLLKPDDQSSSASNSKKIILEVGCGVGNFIWPLLAKSSDAKFHCFDFSTRAIDLIKSHPNYDPTRINAFVFDLTSPPPALSIKLSECSSDFDLAQDTSSHPVTQTVDLISCIFVFSALPPDKHQTSVQTLIEILKPGGTILFQDYAINDAAQLRFHQRPSAAYSSVPSLLSSDMAFYKRADGTFSYFFSLDEVRALFSPTLECLECGFRERHTINRKEGLDIPRKFVQARFRKRLERSQS